MSLNYSFDGLMDLLDEELQRINQATHSGSADDLERVVERLGIRARPAVEVWRRLWPKVAENPSVKDLAENRMFRREPGTREPFARAIADILVVNTEIAADVKAIMEGRAIAVRAEHSNETLPTARSAPRADAQQGAMRIDARAPKPTVKARSTSKQQPWDGKWDRREQLGKGGHGLVYRTTPKEEASHSYVMKVLKDQKDPERRERMYREVQALAALDHPNIPKVVDANAAEFCDISVPLYFVCDYIEGATLDRYVETEGPLSIEEAVRIAISLAETLSFCHDRGILHRDVKPDNVILRKEDHTPVLIDFGQSFNSDDENADGLTPTGQQLGNRFLHLPELQTGGSTKRHAESDIAQCCGVLFFAIAGFAPEHLRDHEGRKPHERARAANILGTDIPVSLVRLFDRGFEHLLADRYRSFRAFEGALHEILDELRTGSLEAHTVDTGDPVEKLKTYVEAGNKRRLRDLLNAEFDKFAGELDSLGHDHTTDYAPDELAKRLDVYDHVAAPLCRLAATGAAWWVAGAERSWVELIESLANPPLLSPVDPHWNLLRRYPALLVTYAIGVTACDSGNYEALKTEVAGTLSHRNAEGTTRAFVRSVRMGWHPAMARRPYARFLGR